MSNSAVGAVPVGVPVKRSPWRRPYRVPGRSLLRFAITGGASVVLDTGLLALLHGVLRVWLPAAVLLAVAIAFVFNFALNRLWSFGSSAPIGPQLLRYLILGGANWIFSVVGVSGLATIGLHYLVAKMVVLLVASGLNYIGYRLWVFR